ncbi:MAG TPA: class I SAM-dependent methyltransferase [Usitatibacter sp.]|nr:class I SAM-dependent methyltransferase [Usitatibacter sp.]
MNELPFTGERFVPGARGEIWVEHWHRYHFALRWVAGKRVLDAACGEGYGTALLARSAASVTGIDISAQAIEHAKAAYAGIANAAFACAPCTAIPLEDGSVDVAVSFETIEHLAEQERFLDELARVLTPGGVVLLSCPNKLEYADKRSYVNEFHVKELYREELAALVAARWPHSTWFAQRPSFFSVIAPEGGVAAGELVETDESDPAQAKATLSHPLYFVVAASREKACLDATAPALSVLADRGDWVHRDYEKVMGMLEESAARGESLEARLVLRDADVTRLGHELASLIAERDDIQRRLAEGHQALQAARAELAARALQLSEKQHELDARRGWRWWLRLPFIRLGILK